MGLLLGLLLGVVLGGFLPQDQFPGADNLFRFLSKAYISLRKGLFVLLLLTTIIVGIAQTGDIRAMGRMGAKALHYFEIVTTLALFIGLAVANRLQSDANLPLDLGAHAAVAAVKAETGWEIARHLFPSDLIQRAAKVTASPA